MTAETKPNKMSMARELLARLKTEQLPDGVSIRQRFIDVAVTELKLTKGGATTYYNNLRNEANGEPLYKYIKGAKKKPAVSEPEQTESSAGDVMSTFDEEEPQAE